MEPQTTVMRYKLSEDIFQLPLLTPAAFTTWHFPWKVATPILNATAYTNTQRELIL